MCLCVSVCVCVCVCVCVVSVGGAEVAVQEATHHQRVAIIRVQNYGKCVNIWRRLAG